MAVDTLQATFENNLTPSFRELVEFVLANKSDRTFKGYTDEQIISMLRDGIENHSLYYEQGLDGRIKGMILASVDSQRKLLWVDENLAMSLGTLRRFAQKAKINFPNYSIAGKRHGRDVYFDTAKLYSKLI